MRLGTRHGNRDRKLRRVCGKWCLARQGEGGWEFEKEAPLAEGRMEIEDKWMMVRRWGRSVRADQI